MNTTRRDFLQVAGGIAATGAIMGALSPEAHAQAGGTVTEHVLAPLPYVYDALEPYIDAKTMELHHGKHHAAYVSGLNAAEAALAKARADNDFTLVQHWSKRAAFNGGGHFLHSMFWKVMAPTGAGGGEPEGALRDAINRDFGGFEPFKQQFNAAAAQVEGGGWGLLHYRPEDDRLIILQAENQHKLSPWGAWPILGLDVWEHAYYLKYQNRRTDYIDAWWNVVNWKQVADNLAALKK
ncbi:MAG TPA: superoxide dismutase [Candidatus Hydrogenedentes bacterium]|nr:superoxide dismutase [Candidatus Hydrogenedentota bacterium]